MAGFSAGGYQVVISRCETSIAFRVLGPLGERCVEEECACAIDFVFCHDGRGSGGQNGCICESCLLHCFASSVCAGIACLRNEDGYSETA